ncbi:hypothetical protein WJX73_001072 [Symbiochloris irregularis]|uniref:RanBD1 domain-containing protein n=1 Tax=Symbiochloris irregularis TaxID=706552 RepID=A0AAW1PDN1_9CHLO
MSKRPTDKDIPAAKKRVNDRQLTKDDRDESEDEEELAAGDFQRANEETMKKRRVLKARKSAASAPATGSANPFGGFSLLPGTNAAAPPAATASQPAADSTEAKAGEAKPDSAAAAKESEAASAAVSSGLDTSAEMSLDQGGGTAPGQDAAGSVPETATAPADTALAVPARPFSATFGQASNFKSVAEEGGTGGFGAFGGLAGSSASAFGQGTSSGFTFATPTTGQGFSGSMFGGDKPALVANGNGTSIAEAGGPSHLLPVPREPVSNGEEEERTQWEGEGALYEFEGGWKERGKGHMKVNVPKPHHAPGAAPDASKAPARLIMRRRQDLRLLLNANLWPGMVLTTMEGSKGVSFPCINAAGSAERPAAEAQAPDAPKQDLKTFAFRPRGQEALTGFKDAVEHAKEPQGDEAV